MRVQEPVAVAGVAAGVASIGANADAFHSSSACVSPIARRMMMILNR